MRQFRYWLSDKYNWLKTFIINGDIQSNTDGFTIIEEGRMELTIKGNIHNFSGKKLICHKGDITINGITTKGVSFFTYE